MIPPTAKQAKEESAAVHGEGCSSGSTPSSWVTCTRTASSGSVCTSRATASAVGRVSPIRWYRSASSACSARGERRISSRSTSTSWATASFWVPTEANSPSAIENAPATSPAIPVRTIVARSAPPPPTPAINPMLVTNPSIAPNTAARSQPPDTSPWWWPP